MIRDPTERAVSHLYYEYAFNKWFHSLSADDKVAEVKKRFRTDGFRRNDNYQTFRLAGIPPKAVPSNSTNERATEILETAWTNLVNGTVYFGITDDWSRSVCVFWRTFVSVQVEGVDFNSRAGLGQEDDDGARSYVERFDTPFLLEIQETNRLDMILYGRAIAHFRRRVKRLGCDDAKDMLSRQLDPSHLDVPSAATSDGVTVEGWVNGKTWERARRKRRRSDDGGSERGTDGQRVRTSGQGAEDGVRELVRGMMVDSTIFNS
jgi:hypothetical protein